MMMRIMMAMTTMTVTMTKIINKVVFAPSKTRR